MIFFKFWKSDDHVSMVSCQKGPNRHAYALQIGPFWPGGGGGGGGGGTPYMLGDMDVPRFWPPFLTLWGLNTIFLGYFFSSTNTKTIFLVPVLAELDLFGPKFHYSLDLFGSNFQQPAAHPRQFSDQVSPPPGLLAGYPRYECSLISKSIINVHDDVMT